MPKAATGAVLQKNSTAEMMVSSNFSLSFQSFQRPSKFGHTLNDHNAKRSKGDQASVCGAISPAEHQKQQLELFFKGVQRPRRWCPQISVSAFGPFNDLANLVTFSTITTERIRQEIRPRLVVPFHQLNAESSAQSCSSKEFDGGDDGSRRL
jgi:hypothetical protein